jgi:PTH1 family peptidyl-tRNA hydrolase
MDKKLIVGLGNFPKEYKNTRHNIGFKVIDAICDELNSPISYKMFNGEFAKVIIDNNECFIAKPLTYMNLSGDFVSQLVQYLRIDIKNIIVICDDVNLKVGEIRIRTAGSSGGQKGLRDIINKLNSENITRIRIGISKPRGSKVSLADYVLGNFGKDEISDIKKSITKVKNAVIEFLQNESSIDRLMNKYNG